MDYEKLHKDTINRLQQMVSCGKITVETACGICADFVPESEDERIRQYLIKCFTGIVDCAPNIKGKDVLTWLEKVGEQKTEVKYVYTKFRIGDVIVEIKPNGYCQPVRVKYVGEGSYSCESDDGKKFLSFPITSQDEYELVAKKIEQKSAEWHREDEQNLNACLGYIPDEFLRRWLTDVIHVKYDKQDWSEEDEKMCTKTIFALAGFMGNEDKIDWIKSLKQRIGG